MNTPGTITHSGHVVKAISIRTVWNTKNRTSTRMRPAPSTTAARPLRARQAIIGVPLAAGPKSLGARVAGLGGAGRILRLGALVRRTDLACVDAAIDGGPPRD